MEPNPAYSVTQPRITASDVKMEHNRAYSAIQPQAADE